MKVTVIMAAYNAQAYLPQALDSICTQSLQDYEVIVINDGSSDQTPDILQAYSKKYPFLKVLHQKNQGPSAARNAGLALAGGEYLYFFDADDLVEPDTLESLYHRAISMQADIVIAKYNIFNAYGVSPVNTLNSLVAQDHIAPYDSRILLTFTLWNKLFRRDLIESHRISFPPVSYSEDGVFTMDAVLHAQRITGLNQVVLHYRRDYSPGTASITARPSQKKLQDYLTAHELIKKNISAAILSSYPAYHSLEEALAGEITFRPLIHTLYAKEIQTLFTQFYCHIWQIDSACRREILRAITDKLREAPISVREATAARFPFLNIRARRLNPEDLLREAALSIVFYAVYEKEEDFLDSLVSLLASNFVSYRILLPSYTKEAIRRRCLLQENMIFIDTEPMRDPDRYSEGSSDFYTRALLYLRTHFPREENLSPGLPDSYVLLCDNYFIYSYRFLSTAVNLLQNRSLDYCTELIYGLTQNRRLPLSCHRLSYQAKTDGSAHLQYAVLDGLFANKVFSANYLTGMTEITPPKQGYEIFCNHETIFFKGDEGDFIDYLHRLRPETFDPETAADLIARSPVLENPPEDLLPSKQTAAPNPSFIQKLIARFKNML